MGDASPAMAMVTNMPVEESRSHTRTPDELRSGCRTLESPAGDPKRPDDKRHPISQTRVPELYCQAGPRRAMPIPSCAARMGETRLVATSRISAPAQIGRPPAAATGIRLFDERDHHRRLVRNRARCNSANTGAGPRQGGWIEATGAPGAQPVSSTGRC